MFFKILYTVKCEKFNRVVANQWSKYYDRCLFHTSAKIETTSKDWKVLFT